MPHPILDNPEILRAIFHPRPDYPLGVVAPAGHPLSIQVEPGVSVGARLYAANAEAPVIVFWHGNGEIAADHDTLAPLYTRMRIALLVVDYRGYGKSTGTPTCSTLLSDARIVFRSARNLLEDQGLTPSRLYVMGRSLGSAAAIDVAAGAEDELAGLILESGFADTFALLARLGIQVRGATEARDGFGQIDKIARVSVPTLVIHGEDDVLIPAHDGEELFRHSGAEDKRLLLIPGAGHNDLILVGQTQYLEAIRAFVWGDAGG
jgi:pimeloyl-ACP methyl ester carboxylesterase